MATPPPDTASPEDETPGTFTGILADDPDVVVTERAEPATVLRLPGIDNRERSLPIRQGDLSRLLLAEPGLSDEDRKLLGEFGQILGATFHSEFYEKLRELKELYAPLDPDADYVTLEGHTRPRSEQSDEEFLVPFEATLEKANYRQLDLQVIEAAVSAPNENGLTFSPDFRLFEHMKIYARGFTRITRTYRSVKTKFLKRTVHLDAYQRLLIALKFKADPKLDPFVRSDVVYLRMFKDVPHVDMEMHLPEQGTKVRMRWIDKAQIASPLVVGLPTLAFKILGIGVALASLSPVAMGTLIIAPISAGANSFFGFQRAKQRHLSHMIRSLYYLTLANNASVLTRLIDSAEDEEYKEAMLAYFFLWRAIDDPDPWDKSKLDAHIESFLEAKTGIEINFEVADALDKLFRLGLAWRDPQGHLHANPLPKALKALDRAWDNTFRY